MKSECRGVVYQIGLFCLLVAVAVFLAGCSNPEKAKAQHLAQGEAYLKDSKFQEASLEFRNAIQIDDNLAAGHWGLARAYEGLERYPEMLDALRKTIIKDPNNLEARIKLGIGTRVPFGEASRRHRRMSALRSIRRSIAKSLASTGWSGPRS